MVFKVNEPRLFRGEGRWIDDDIGGAMMKLLIMIVVVTVCFIWPRKWKKFKQEYDKEVVEIWGYLTKKII